MVKPFSRNTRLENHSKEPLKVVKEVEYGEFPETVLTIPPGEHSYMCYDTLGIEYNGGRLVKVLFYMGDQQTKRISTSQIRDHEKIIFFKHKDGTIDHNLIKGSMIQMNGIVISMKGALKKIKSLLK
ncbi:hypothetical protein I3760_04G166000 [Carya illinoinensis]|uniref:Uncharacterized protein n=2 Tax=Carya illinoinensis TaxID=32201 RepID=A0A922F9U1_CARIL|nr:hypothetical protein I3760_04G166000 [Carya illinoinensis]KAG6718728.1 hypothetical protein I3842_04G167000 [Carya illinoinensis]KAG6718729.1 hypothetical protein I3842_04G167000 [Carya illinoinensis]KAG6718730.1 hypothetical protein I3842_04G167000 [Carya illinoinensis]KAG6718731.1 hypothetical protein I3842_04G167000 [Carya illinoinensis]